jgi:acyl-CoA dehydrogenase
MQRRLFTEDHSAYRDMVRRFIGDQIVPHHGEWEKAGQVPRELAQGLGELGVLGLTFPTEFGGGGESSYVYNVVLDEELTRAFVSIGSLRCHMDVVLPYFLSLCTPEQQQRWFPGLVSGNLLTAIAMTEPGTGSDLGGIRTTATRDGSDYVLNGAKTFITGGYVADLVIVVARTSKDPANRRSGLTLLVVEEGMPGFVRSRKLEKLGLKAQDTAELSFEDVRVPAANVLGEEGEAFQYLSQNLAKERLSVAVESVATARAALDTTLAYVRERQVFGQPVGAFQNTKFELASVATDIEAAQAMTDRAVEELDRKTLRPEEAAMAKLFCTEMQGRVMDRCLQLFGGYGYMLEYPIARLYADARVSRIYGGTSEVMRLIISKSLGL